MTSSISSSVSTPSASTPIPLPRIDNPVHQYRLPVGVLMDPPNKETDQPLPGSGSGKPPFVHCCIPRQNRRQRFVLPRFHAFYLFLKKFSVARLVFRHFHDDAVKIGDIVLPTDPIRGGNDLIAYGVDKSFMSARAKIPCSAQAANFASAIFQVSASI